METAAFLALAGGLAAAARAYQSASRAAEQAVVEGRLKTFETLSAGTLRRCHSNHSNEMALAPTSVDVEHYPVIHLRQQFPGIACMDSPLVSRRWPKNQNFVGEGEEVITTQTLHPHPNAPPHQPKAFLACGPCERIYWDPTTVRAAIVTCGGLCPGLNTVIRELVMALHYTYGVRHGNVLGVANGYRGFYEDPLVPLTPDNVSAIQREGGTVLGSSRGGFHLDKILEAVVRERLNMVFIIGGDGTHRGALELLKGATTRGLKLTVACVPKTIDNDIGLIDKSFGFDTAVEQAVHPLTCAHTEALAAKNGVGLVKLMGRQSGFIALYASLASRDVNVTLIPEAPWRLSSLLSYLEARLDSRGHCLIAVAEGAECLEQKEARRGEGGRGGVSVDQAAAVAAPSPTEASATTTSRGASGATAAAPAAPGSGSSCPSSSSSPSLQPGPRRDESGNPILEDVGVWLKEQIAGHFKRIGKPLNLKYIDPSYIIRSAPANAADSNLCTTLAFNCVHGAMGGYTGFTVGTVDNQVVMIPITVVAGKKPRLVDPEGRLYARMCNFTGQPNLNN